MDRQRKGKFLLQFSGAGVTRGKPLRLSACARSVGAISILALLGLVVRVVDASTVTSSTAAPAGGYVEVTYTVTATGSEELKDFHILPADTNPNTPVKGAVSGKPTNWTAEKSKKGIHFKAGQQGAEITAANSPQTFKVRVSEDDFKDGLVRWRTTHDNDYDATDGQVDSGPDEGEDSTHGPRCFVDIIPTEVPYGTATQLFLESSESSCDYELYAIGNTTGMPDLWDHASFASWAASNPPPAGWSLAFSNMAGITNPSGATNSPTCTVPNNPSLLANVFYLVAYIETEPDDLSETYLEPSSVQMITIIAP